ncbi:hypothetical protein MUB13_28015 [Pseudomonas aeruginosa]|uniref:hypothetical protein n=1 Tax=Pseudomonas aeruginosa TaxID=287 RepID=UPI000FC415A9|nr:hypothetical protein [Pseudomonas aeruginosa]MCJ1952709.1 hypothetical protein [Pseudomonas aeruginosa]MCO3976446.1 hypothetical protein [Pseudomonas aeruginosa]RUB40747.1 hypothetical protein IPC1432_01855 [Pseudomonas aeruginosa]HBO5633773.1 hypothetical protein [Pseudomonas aeruginosa]HBO5958756.1 hypothetical protein [Pseudomonas aeruginosa]
MKLPATYQTEVYPTGSGYLAIKQHDAVQDEDEIVLLSFEQARLVAHELLRLADEPEGDS